MERTQKQKDWAYGRLDDILSYKVPIKLHAFTQSHYQVAIFCVCVLNDDHEGKSFPQQKDSSRISSMKQKLLRYGVCYEHVC